MQENSHSRRKFLKQSSLIAASGLLIPDLVKAAYEIGPSTAKIRLQKDDVILFQGDSITDAGRKKDDEGFNTAAVMGSGYAMIAASQLLFQHADKNLKIYNRGISGNKVYQLAERWEKDCLNLKPTVLSILIGVNDYWHFLNGKYTGTIRTYRDDFRGLLEKTREKYPDLKLIVGEPFAIKGIKAVDEKWFPAFNEYRSAAKEIATSFKAYWIPYQTVFEKAVKAAPGVYWTNDGVHPSLAGAHLMAHAWMEAVKG
jgi:lysophospholipase L1-like esterase